jgi:hypothetical protein
MFFYENVKPGSLANVHKVGIHITTQKMKISSTSKTCDMSDLVLMHISNFQKGNTCYDGVNFSGLNS